MKGIEFEIESSGDDLRKNSANATSWQESLEQLSNEDAIAFSVKVIKALEFKVKEHNSSHDNKVSLAQLKKVYRRAAGNVFAEVPELEDDKGKWAMARVNMYLRFLQGEPFSNQLKATSTVESIEGVDLMDSIIPLDKDFIKADEDIVKFELNYKFKDVNDLYLEDEDNNTLGFYFVD
tara:strand:- start:384 stop:917 length:534 start_codon:yes stop_codon:yes gene_type:complete